MTADYASRLHLLRDTLATSGCDGFLVPMADEFQSEYVPASARRIEFLSGFTGSAGFIVVLKDKAAFFTDGRYTLQAQQQVPGEVFVVHDIAVKAPPEWLSENVVQGQSIAYDPWLHTEETISRLKKALTNVGAQLIALPHNPVDSIWRDRPDPPVVPIHAYDIIYAGKTSAEKRLQIAKELQNKNLAAAIISDPASVAWLLNIRGGDVDNTPLPLSFAILYENSHVKWFVDPRKVTTGLDTYLGTEVIIEHIDQFSHALDRLGHQAKAVRIDPAETANAIFERLRAANVKLDCGEDPCVLPKACKNAVELEGMRSCHRRDGAALVRFFSWLDVNMATGEVTEMSAEEKLASFRSSNNLYRGPSFDTIAGVGGHGAVVHYRATRATNRRLELGQIFLLDSGGQYLDGTTDVTRTLALGAPTHEMRDRFTRVLKGHIALATIRFPEGTTGSELDVLARQYLWAQGLDYNHGTGHGVGNYLGVHEGPQSISKRSKVKLMPGMVVSNEPGYYKAGAYGIRIENLQAVVEIAGLSSERTMYGFETLTLVPIDKRLIDLTLLTEDELGWLNAYHARIREALRPMVDEASVSWLENATSPL